MILLQEAIQLDMLPKKITEWVSCDLDKEKKQSDRYVTMSSLRFDKIKKGPGWNGPKYNK